MHIGGIAARGLLLPVLVSAALRGGAEFDVAASRVLVTYAWASFCEPATLTNWSCEWCDTASLAASLLARVDFSLLPRVKPRIPRFAFVVLAQMKARR